MALLANELEGIKVTNEVVPESLEVQGDGQLPDQVLVNLVKNAADAVGEVATPELRLSGELQFGRVILKVTDNGPGIPDEVRDKVFVPFFMTKRDGAAYA